MAVPTQGARASIAELRRAGYTAELREYAGVEHDISNEEQGDILERMGRAADGLGVAAPAP
jgi:phospholipase/carboxylesterase